MTEPVPCMLAADRIATARSALKSAAFCRGFQPAIADEAVTELLTDLRHFCGARRIDFDRCNAAADRHFVVEMKGGRA